MKWGVRRTPEQLGHKKKWKVKIQNPLGSKEERYKKKVAKLDTKEEEIRRKEEIKRRKEELSKRQEALKQKPSNEKKEEKPKTEVPKNRSASQLSDQELSDILKRYDLETRYNKMLSDKAKSQIPAGKRRLMEILEKSGTQVATTYATKAITALVEAGLDKMKHRRSGGSP